MKIIFVQFLLFLIIFGAGLAIINEGKNLYFSPLFAKAFSPLDFNADYQQFETRIGFKRGLGRYICLHYEFVD